MANVTIRKATKAEVGNRTGISMYIIERDGLFVGLIEKRTNTRHDIHPFKVFERQGANMVHKMVEVFYTDADSAKIGPSFDYDKCRIGGLTAAKLYARKHFAIYGVPA